MYYIHHFAHHETLRRACDWLGQLGYRPSVPGPGEAASPWLTLNVPTARLAEVELLVNAAENSDPLGWPSFWDEARLPHSAPGRASVRADEDRANGARDRDRLASDRQDRSLRPHRVRTAPRGHGPLGPGFRPHAGAGVRPTRSATAPPTQARAKADGSGTACTPGSSAKRMPPMPIVSPSVSEPRLRTAEPIFSLVET